VPLRLEKSLGGSSTRRSITESTIRQRVAEGKSLRLTIPGSKLLPMLYGLLLDSAVGQTNTNWTRSYLVRTFVYDVRPGSQRQVVHPTRPVRATTTPLLYTCFVALQDVDSTWVPTTWLPGTHTVDNHGLFGRICRGGPGNLEQMRGQNHRSWACQRFVYL
jgi:hypothetical protein